MDADAARWQRAKVLAVDDHLANLVTLDAVLSQDFDVVRANSGEEALAILESRQDIDVILLDVQMPMMDGFQAAAKMKEIPGCRDIPIVFVSAVYREDPFIRAGYNVGGVDYFTKPFDPQIIRAKVAIYAAFRQKSALLRECERLKNLPMSVVIMDATGRVRAMNSQPLDHGLAWWTADGALREGVSSAIARVIATGETASETVDVSNGEGFRSLVCTASPLKEQDTGAPGIVLIVREVTERHIVSA